MSDTDKDIVDRKTLLAQKNYRLPARMLEQHPEIGFFPSLTAQRIWHLEKWLYPADAGKHDIVELEEEGNIEELKKLPGGFRYTEKGMLNQFNRDLAKHALFHFSRQTQEELVASKFAESSGFKKKLEEIKKNE